MTQSSNAPWAQRAFGIDDIAVWPDGTYAELGDVWNGGHGWKSDDYLMVNLDDATQLEATLKAHGLEDVAAELTAGLGDAPPG